MFLPFSIRNAILALLFVCQLIFWSANAQESDKHFDRDLNEVDDDQRDFYSVLLHYQKYSPDSELQSCESDDDCTEGNNLQCHEELRMCVCRLYYEPDPKKPKNCKKCPKKGKKCNFCCFGPNFECIDGECVRCFKDDDNKNYCNISDEGILSITASQIILSTALVMGIIALGAILLRVCVRTKRVTPRVGGHTMTVNPETTDAIPRNGIRASLTSLQKRIISQLKDRPPRYETRHNYEYRQRETPEVRVTSASLPVPNEPPPNYDGTIAANDELPPSYSSSVIAASTAINPSNSLGVQNPAYVIDPTETSRVNFSPSTATRIDETTRANDKKNDKVVHM